MCKGDCDCEGYMIKHGSCSLFNIWVRTKE